jgi:hypothetical protein
MTLVTAHTGGWHTSRLLEAAGQGIGRMDESPWWRANSFRWMTTYSAAAAPAVPLMVCPPGSTKPVVVCERM